MYVQDVALCSRCRPGTYKPEVGGFVFACTPCADGLVDNDSDPVTECVPPLGFEVTSFKRTGSADSTHLLKGKASNKYAIGTTYQFAPIDQLKTSGLTETEKETISFSMAGAPPGFLIDTVTVRAMMERCGYLCGICF